MRRIFTIVAYIILIESVLMGCNSAIDDTNDTNNRNEADTTPPEVNKSTPIDGTMDYDVRGEISVEFNEAMNESTVKTSYTLDRILSPTEKESVSGIVSYQSSTHIATYIPDEPLQQNTKYVATVNSAAMDNSGNRLIQQYQWQFEATSLPKVLEVYATDYPNADSAVFPETGSFTIKFSEAIRVDTLSTDTDPPSIATPSVRLIDANDKILLSQIIYYPPTNDSETAYAIFSPDGTKLLLSTDYRLRIANVEDLSGNTMGTPHIFSFKTRSPLWVGTKKIVGTGKGIATDAKGSVFVAGNTSEILDPEETRVNIFQDFYVTKYDIEGIQQWTRQLGVVNSATNGNNITTDTNGNVFVVGDTEGNLDGIRKGIFDAVLTKYDTDGVIQWTRQLGVVNESTIGNSVASDLNGNVFVAGNTGGILDPEETRVTVTYSDRFVTKYNTDGEWQWTRQLGAADAATRGRGLATDPNGNVFLAGETDTVLDPDETRVNISKDLFVAKYDTNGVIQWIRQLGVAYSFAVATDFNGNAFLTGYTDSDFDDKLWAGGSDFVVAKYDADGVKQWTTRGGAGQSANAFGEDIATDSNGNAFVTGYTDGGFAFVTKYNTGGERAWTQLLGEGEVFSTYGWGIATDYIGNAFVTGWITNNGGETFVTKYDTGGNIK